MIRIPMVNHVLATAVVAGALAFGVSQAFAAPNPQPSRESACQEDLCSQWCGGAGYCEPTGACICI